MKYNYYYLTKEKILKQNLSEEELERRFRFMNGRMRVDYYEKIRHCQEDIIVPLSAKRYLIYKEISDNFLGREFLAKELTVFLKKSAIVKEVSKSNPIRFLYEFYRKKILIPVFINKDDRRTGYNPVPERIIKINPNAKIIETGEDVDNSLLENFLSAVTNDDGSFDMDAFSQFEKQAEKEKDKINKFVSSINKLTEAIKEIAQEKQLKKMGNLPISSLNLSFRTKRFIERYNRFIERHKPYHSFPERSSLNTLGDLVKTTYRDLRFSIKGYGPKTFDEIEKILTDYGLELKK